MADSAGNMDEVIRKGSVDNAVVIGDVENNGGSLNLRSAGTTKISITPQGAMKFTPMSNPPGTCNPSFRGQIYYDLHDDKLEVCAKNIIGQFSWQNMH